jgi:hypothetical protein
MLQYSSSKVNPIATAYDYFSIQDTPMGCFWLYRAGEQSFGFDQTTINQCHQLDPEQLISLRHGIRNEFAFLCLDGGGAGG